MSGFRFYAVSFYAMSFLCYYVCDSFHFKPSFSSKRLTATPTQLPMSTRFILGENSESYDHLRFTIMGGGAFSLALAKVLSYKNISCNLLVRNQDVADYINTHHYHPKYLNTSLLPTQLWATSDPVSAMSNVDFVVHAVPMQESRKFLESMKQYLPPDVPILSVTKGVELSTFSLMNDIIAETLGTERRAAYLSGPSFAQEIMDGEATAVVIASLDGALSKELADIFSSVVFRCHTSKDVKVKCCSILVI